MPDQTNSDDQAPPPVEMCHDDKRLIITTRDEYASDEAELRVFFDEDGRLSITADEGWYRDSHESYQQIGTVILPRDYAVALAKWILAHA